MSGYTARELQEIIRWPIYHMCWNIRDFAETFKSRVCCHQCGRIIGKRVKRDFCSEKCAKAVLT